jgi:hypothetical protein
MAMRDVLRAFVIGCLTVGGGPGAAAQEGTYTISHYTLRISPEVPSRVVAVQAVVDIDNPDHDTTFVFGLNDNYDSLSVTADGIPVRVEREHGWVSVTSAAPAGILRLEFSMQGNLGTSADERRQVVEDSSLFLLWSDRFYPIDFNRWAPVRTEIDLPQEFAVIAPGLLVSRRPSGHRLVSVFETTRPTVSFSVLADARWISTERTVGGMRMQTLLHPESQKFAEQIFSSAQEVIGYFSSILAPYPFDQYTFVTTTGVYARRAYPGFVGYEPRYLEKEFTTTGHDAHETSLLWWTYTSHGRGTGSFQWSEGFGDYAELMYDRAFGKPVPPIFSRFRSEYLALPADKDFLYCELGGNTPQKFVHGRYPWLMHLVRHVVGDSAFVRGMQLVFARFAHRTFSMDEFVVTLEEGCGQSLRWWRDEWLERKGVPELSMSVHSDSTGSGVRVTCTVDQHGNVYHLPLDIGVETGSGITVHRVTLGEAHQNFTFELKEKPKKVTLDPAGWLLLRIVPQKP